MRRWYWLAVGIVLHLGQEHWTIWGWRERGSYAAGNADSRRSTAVADQIACAARGILMPEVDDKYVEGSVDIVRIYFLTCCGVTHYEADARRRSNGASVLSLVTCLSSVPLPKQWIAARAVLPCRQNHTFGL